MALKYPMIKYTRQSLKEGIIQEEHWLPFFINRLDTLEVYAKSNFLSMDSKERNVKQDLSDNNISMLGNKLAKSTAADDMAACIANASIPLYHKFNVPKNIRMNVIQFHPLILFYHQIVTF